MNAHETFTYLKALSYVPTCVLESDSEEQRAFFFFFFFAVFTILHFADWILLLLKD